MFCLLSLSGRTTALDSALREVGIHPVPAPEAVKLTIIRMHKREGEDRRLEPSYSDAVDLLAYCMLGRAPFIDSNDLPAADRAEDRIEAAIAAGDSPDAKFILLALHSGVISAEIADQLDVGDNS